MAGWIPPVQTPGSCTWGYRTKLPAQPEEGSSTRTGKRRQADLSPAMFSEAKGGQTSQRKNVFHSVKGKVAADMGSSDQGKKRRN